MRNFATTTAMLSLFAYPLAASADTLPCTDPDLVVKAAGVADGLTSPLFGQIKLLDKPFGMHDHPNHSSPEDAQRCEADVITNRGRMTMYYGVVTANDKSYVQVALIPSSLKNLVTGPQDATPNQDPQPDSSHWEDVEPRAKRKCATDFSTDFNMQAACVRIQKEGWEQLHKGDQPVHVEPTASETVPPVSSRWEEVLPTVKRNCATEWPTDFSMQSHCISAQRTGWEKIHEGDQPVPVAPTARQMPAQAAAPASVAAPATQEPVPQTPAYLDGQKARTDYEAWFNDLIDGDFRNGVLFWAAHRGDKRPPGCHFSLPDFEAGCNKAQAMLKGSDARRKSEPDFKLGWNSR
jgi:hypothetical protein